MHCIELLWFNTFLLIVLRFGLLEPSVVLEHVLNEYFICDYILFRFDHDTHILHLRCWCLSYGCVQHSGFIIINCYMDLIILSMDLFWIALLFVVLTFLYWVFIVLLNNLHTCVRPFSYVNSKFMCYMLYVYFYSIGNICVDLICVLHFYFSRYHLSMWHDALHDSLCYVKPLHMRPFYFFVTLTFRHAGLLSVMLNFILIVLLFVLLRYLLLC